jgi:hypothetical protein
MPEAGRWHSSALIDNNRMILESRASSADTASLFWHSEHSIHIPGGFTTSPTVQSFGIDQMTHDQRVVLVKGIWDTIAAGPYRAASQAA